MSATPPADLPLLSAAQTGTAIPSDSEGALDRPEEWDCERIFPAYRAWLEEGHAPSDWRHAGKVFIDAETGRTYTWAQWLEWAEDEGCGAGLLPPAASAAPLQKLAAGAGILATSIAAIAASGGGSGPKSPG